MKKIKHLTYSLLLFTIVLGACGSQDQADAEQLEEINEQVESLYNEEMTDLADDASIESFEEVEESIQAVDEVELNDENAKSFAEIEDLYNNATDMYTLEEAIQELFVADIVVAEVELDEIAELSTQLAEIDSEQWTRYVPRQEERLAEAEEQLENILHAEKLVDQFYLDGDRINRESTREEETIAKEAVTLVKNEMIREELEIRLAKVDQTLAKVEEEQRIQAERAAKSIGNFAGLYHESEDNYLVTISEDSYEGFIPHSDVFFQYEIKEIHHNSGTEISLVLYHEEYDGAGLIIPEITQEAVWRLTDDGNYLQIEHSNLRRINEEEYEKIRNPYDMDF